MEVEYMPQNIPIKDLKDTSGISELCHTVKAPYSITPNGYSDMVLINVDIFESDVIRSAFYHELEIGERQIRENKTRDAQKHLAALRSKYNL